MLADLWSEVLGKSVGYLGDDLDGPEMQMRQTHPAWFAYELRQMLARFQADGAVANEKGLADLEGLLGASTLLSGLRSRDGARVANPIRVTSLR